MTAILSDRQTTSIRHMENMLRIIFKDPDLKDLLRYDREALEHLLTFPEHFPAFRNCNYTGLTGPTTISIPLYHEERELNAKDAEKTYEELFYRISDDLAQAYEEGKRLSIHVGEAHTDRGALLVNIMALDIANRLGITTIGIEAQPKDKVISTWDGRNVTIFGLKGHQQYKESLMGANDGILPETDNCSPQPDLRILNKTLFIPHAFEKAENHVFASDLPHVGLYATKEEMYSEREKHMVKTLREKAQGKPSLHLCGSAHLFGLDKEEMEFPDTKTLTISALQHFYLTPTFPSDKTDPFRKERNVGTVSSDPDKLHADYIILDGYVPTMMDAAVLAKSADKVMGEKLAEEFFEKHPDLRPAHETLGEIELVGRTPKEIGIQR